MYRLFALSASPEAVATRRGARAVVAIAASLTALTAWSNAVQAETIQSALARAYESNPQLNAQRAIVRQTDEGVPQALSGYRPTIRANAALGTGYTDFSVGGIPVAGTTGTVQFGFFPITINSASTHTSIDTKGPSNFNAVGLTAQQSLYDAKTPAQTRAAESQVSAARETLRVIEQSVLLSAASAYMDVLRDTANLEVQRSSVLVLQKMLKDTRSRRAAGEIPQTDVAQAEAHLAAGEASVAAAEATLMATRANYLRIIGSDPDKLLPAAPVDNLSPRTLDLSIAQSRVENPSVTAAVYGVNVAELQVKIAESGLYPTLLLQGNIQDFNFQTTNTLDANSLSRTKFFDSSVWLRLNVPIYEGGREYSIIRQTKEAIGQQEFNLEQVRKQVRANVVQFWGQADATKVEVAAAERQVKAAESVLDGVRDEARLGQRTTLDVLNAQQALVNARVSLIAAQHDRVVTSYNLLSAVGRLSASVLHLPVDIYDPAVHYSQVRDSWIGIRTPDGR